METRKKRHTVLIIDDMADNIKILMEFLKKEYRILPATNGAKGIELAASETHPPDLILLDILMPGMDGYDVCRKLKAGEKTRHIPIIFVTAVSEVLDAAKGFELGAVDYITKPFHPPVVKARIKTHLDLVKQKNELEEVNATKDKLFSTIAHDMRNKFSALLNTIELMELYYNEYNETEKQEELKNILQSSRQIYKLFENLFTWARAQTKSIDINPVDIDLSEAVQQIAALYGDEITAKQIHFDSKVDSGTMVFCDAEMLLFILRNLVHNAIKYCDAREYIHITAHVDEAGQQQVMVTDTGRGMQQELCRNIFRLAARRSRPGTRDETGSGLGLLLVKEFAELNKGSVHITSQENVGTKVAVTLPATRP